MPTYHFQCTACEHTFERVMPMGSKQLPPCPKCKKPARKLIRPPMIHFKGSGFYKTDSAKQTSSPKITPSKSTEGAPKKAESTPTPPAST
jgi:putative FmdB family regulatory protein